MAKKAVAVLGLNSFGKSLAIELAESGIEVLAADESEEMIDQVADQVTTAVAADLASAENIKDLGIENMDSVVVTMSGNLEASIMCVMVAKELGVPQVIVRARDERTKEILIRLGADQVLLPDKEYGTRLARKIRSANFLEFFDLSENAAIVEMAPLKSWVGHSMSELRLRNRYGVNVLGFKTRKGIDTKFDPEAPFTEGSILYIVAEKDFLSRISEE
ncbi:MAG: TrkA family potassium uptake protein [Lachnospiraceae bacterium]|nr:TrkA family potassium uptake protein [Lachnospiraceae bacterium]